MIDRATLFWLCAALLAGCGKTPQAAPPELELGGEPVPVPAQVAAYFAVRSIDGLGDRVAEIVGRALSIAAAAPDARRERAAAVARRLSLPEALAPELDLSRTVWFAALVDPKRWLASVPYRDRDALEAALRAAAPEAPRAGPLRRVGAVFVATAPGHLLVTDSPDTFAALSPFMLRTLVPRAPDGDVELHACIANVVSQTGLDADRLMDAFSRLLAEGLPDDEADAASAGVRRLGARFRRYVELGTTLREIVIEAGLGHDELTARVELAALPGGRAHELARSERPGRPFGRELLPDDAWLLLADRAADRRGDAPGFVADAIAAFIAGKFPGAAADPARAAAIDAAFGDYTVAVRRVSPGQDVALAILQARDAAAAERIALDVTGALARRLHLVVAGKPPGAAAPTLTVTPSKLKLAGVKIARYDVAVKAPGGDAGETPPELRPLLGRPDGRVTIALATAGDRLIATVDSGALDEMKRALQARGGDANRPSGGAALWEPPRSDVERVGLVYLGPVQAAQALLDFLPREPRSYLERLERLRAGGGVTLDWGVTPRRAGFALRLRVPLGPLVAIASVLADAYRSGEMKAQLNALVSESARH
ncbi:MAG TPA: hypothetical protein VFF06_25995 [Polyangia bacterium]|nr:hypothetical protein [Polyangia bacterium]